MPRLPSVVGSGLLALAAALPAAWTSAQTGPRWFRDYDAARAESSRTGKPLLICFNADLTGESGNRNMAFSVYRDPQLLRAFDEIVTVVASVDAHESIDGRCERFGHLTCDEHQALERKARRHLFGDRRDIIAPQHILLYPDGSLAWHELYATSVGSIRRAIESAQRGWRQNQRARTRSHVERFRKLVGPADNDPETYLRLSTMFCHAPDDAIAPMLRRIPGANLGRRLIDDFATVAPGRALQGLDGLEQDCPRPLRPVVAAAVDRLRGASVQPFVADTAGHTSGSAATSRPDRPSDKCPLPVLGDAQAIPGVTFGERATPALEGQAGRVTVLLFFLPDDDNLPTQLGIWNKFAESVTHQPVDVIGLGASVAPQSELFLTRQAGFGFAAGNYLFERSRAPYGFTAFPAAVVLDPQGRVRYQGDAYRVFDAAVERLLEELSPARPDR